MSESYRTEGYEFEERVESKTLPTKSIFIKGLLPEVKEALIKAILRENVVEKKEKPELGLNWYSATLLHLHYENYARTDEDFAKLLADALLVGVGEKGSVNTCVKRTSAPDEQRISVWVTLAVKNG